MGFYSHHTQENRGFSIVKSIQKSVLRLWSYFAVLTRRLADCFGTQSLRASVLSRWLCKSPSLYWRSALFWLLVVIQTPSLHPANILHQDRQALQGLESQRRPHVLYDLTLVSIFNTHFMSSWQPKKTRQAKSSIIVRKYTYKRIR